MGFILHFFIFIECKSDKRRGEGTPPYGYVVKWYQWIKPVGAVHGHQTNELRDTGMSRLRRAARMCSSTASENCEYVEKWAHTVRPYGRVTRLPFSFSKQSPVSGMRQVKKQKEVGVKRVETIGVYPLAPAVGTAPAGQARFLSLLKRPLPEM